MRVKRKNYSPALTVIMILWSLFGLMLIYVEPVMVKDVIIPEAYLPFFLLFFPASWFTAAIVWGNNRRGLLTAVGFNLFLLLRIFQLGNGLNLLLILGILIAADRYFN